MPQCVNYDRVVADVVLHGNRLQVSNFFDFGAALSSDGVNRKMRAKASRTFSMSIAPQTFFQI